MRQIYHQHGKSMQTWQERWERVRIDLAGKNALVTGSARSIGRAIAMAIGRAGANVVVNYSKSREEAEETARAIRSFGVKCVALRADVRNPDEVARLVEEAEDALGPLHVLVNNAGVLVRTPFLEISVDEWEWIQQTNLRGYFLVGQAVARRMVAHNIQGKIVNVSSAGAKNASPNLTHYCVAKAGVTMLTKQMALELAPYHINVNEINPGLIETDLNREDIADPEFRNFRLSRIPMKEIGTPDDVTGAVLFLLSEQARLITGASVFIDGGAAV